MVPVGSFISEALDIGQPSKAWQPLDLGNGIMKDKDRPDDFIIHLGWQSRHTIENVARQRVCSEQNVKIKSVRNSTKATWKQPKSFIKTRVAWVLI
jgi:hypothetical protein